MTITKMSIHLARLCYKLWNGLSVPWLIPATCPRSSIGLEHETSNFEVASSSLAGGTRSIFWTCAKKCYCIMVTK